MSTDPNADLIGFTWAVGVSRYTVTESVDWSTMYVRVRHDAPAFVDYSIAAVAVVRRHRELTEEEG